MSDPFPSRLRSAMDMNGLNGERLGELAGISAAAVSRYLAGIRQPTVENVVKLSKALGVSCDYLLGQTAVLEARSLLKKYEAAPLKV